jgi:aspartyl-tRNA(Asn)/glutamyl-tRNA(Gln) amidotransferase subunit B
MGMPGTLPVINAEAVRQTMRTGLALNCTIPSFSKFDRKNYPYPDLMKGYQISQYDLPFCVGGYLDVDVPDERGNRQYTRHVGIIRVHLEEDTARLLHRGAHTLMDINRAGLPLMEIVSAPDISSPEEAQLYLTKLRHILRWIGASTGNMEEGSFRVDANVSVRPTGQKEFGTKVEVKNMNSFKSVRSALEFEVERQTGLIRRGERVAQETRGWVETRGVTVSQRSKEQAHDYRYFPEPDLPPLTTSDSDIEAIKASLPELPDARRDRLIEEYALSPYDAAQITATRATADFFERAAAGMSTEAARTLAGFIVNDLARLLGEAALDVESSPVSAEALSELVSLVESGTINRGIARNLLPDLFETGRTPAELVKERGLAIMRDEPALEKAIDEAIAGNPKAVDDYVKGKESAMMALFGPVMKATKGTADATAVRELLKRKLDAMRET